MFFVDEIQPNSKRIKQIQCTDYLNFCLYSILMALVPYTKPFTLFFFYFRPLAHSLAPSVCLRPQMRLTLKTISSEIWWKCWTLVVVAVVDVCWIHFLVFIETNNIVCCTNALVVRVQRYRYLMLYIGDFYVANRSKMKIIAIRIKCSGGTV